MFRQSGGVLVVVALGAVGGACDTGGREARAQERPRQGAEVRETSPEGVARDPDRAQDGAKSLNDAQIAAVLASIHRGEVLQAQEVLTHRVSPEVRKIAQRMLEDHNSAARSVENTMTRANITPQPNELSRQLTSEATAAVQRLGSMKDEKQVGQSYLQTQARMHERALELIDKDLIPQTSNAQLRDLLRQQRQKISSHLDEIRRAQASMTGEQDAHPDGAKKGDSQGTMPPKGTEPHR